MRLPDCSWKLRIQREAFSVKYTFVLPALDRMDTPVLICDPKGIVVYKNPAAVKSIRLPRRNTSIRCHLRQAEEGELLRIPERKRPSILTLHTGDRPARALVMPYEKGEESGPALSCTGIAEGEICSLWIFPAALQVYAATQPAQYFELLLEELAPDICKLVKEADRLSGLLPGKERREVQQKVDRRIGRLLTTLERLPEGKWFDLRHAVQILLPLSIRRLELFGIRLDYSEDSAVYGKGFAVDLPRMAVLLLHLLTYCASLSGRDSATLRLGALGDGVGIEASVTLNWPPFTVYDSNDLGKLCLLLPNNQLELLVLGSLCKGAGSELRWSLSEEAEYNLTLSLGLPVMQRNAVHACIPDPTELLFLERELEAIFDAVLFERLARQEEE